MDEIKEANVKENMDETIPPLSELFQKGKDFYDAGEYAEAYALFLEDAMNGNPQSTYYLAKLYMYGYYPERNIKKAFHYLIAAYDMGEIGTRVELYDNCEFFNDTNGGRAAYREYLEHCLAQGEWMIAIMIGTEYKNGGAYEKSIPKAIEYFQLALEHDILMGAECLGELYYLGDGIEPDYQKAYDYFMSYDGCESFAKPYYLAEMYRLGLAVEKNIETAKEYYLSILENPSPFAITDQYYIWSEDRMKELEQS